MDVNEILRLSSGPQVATKGGKPMDIARNTIVDTAAEKARLALHVDRHASFQYFPGSHPGSKNHADALVWLIIMSYEAAIFPLPKRSTITFEEYIDNFHRVFASRCKGSEIHQAIVSFKTQATTLETHIIGVEIAGFKPQYWDKSQMGGSS